MVGVREPSWNSQGSEHFQLELRARRSVSRRILRILLDTNVALRAFDANSLDYQRFNDAIRLLREEGRIPTVAPQVLYEAYVVLTRNPNENGWGLTPVNAA